MMTCLQRIILTSSLLLLYTTVKGDSFDDAISKKVRNLNIRGAAIAYYRSDKMEEPMIRAYGKTKAAWPSSNVTPDTTFMIASISKVFTASAVAVLLDQGIISSLDDDICDVVPSTWDTTTTCRNPKYPDVKVTWRMLVTHRSSLMDNIPDARDENRNKISPTYGPTGGYTSDSPAAGNPTCPLDDLAQFYQDLLTNKETETSVGKGVILSNGEELNWYDLIQSNNNNGGIGAWNNYSPGEKNEYSNLAFGYLAALIEFASGQTFPEFCNEHIFDKLDMSTTAWFREDLPTGVSEATPVEFLSRKRFGNIGHYCFIDYASGQLRTTAADLAKWGDAMLNYGATTLWSSDTGQKIVSCQEQDSDGNPISSGCEFGIGWALLDNTMKTKSSTDQWLKKGFKDFDWTDGIWHNGAEAGSQTNLVVLPKAGMYVAVVTNTDMNAEMAAQWLTRNVVETPLPDDSCSDSPLDFRFWGQFRSCAWVTGDIDTRCRNNGVKAHCPKACGSCDACRNSGRQFRLKDGSWKRCWYANDQRCDTVEGLALTCRKKCNQC